MDYRIVFHPAAQAELDRIYDDLADWADPVTAINFVRGIYDFCDGLSTFPQRGTERVDIMPGLRIIGYRRSVSIAFRVSADIVTILGVFHNGRDITARLMEKRL